MPAWIVALLTTSAPALLTLLEQMITAIVNCLTPTDIQGARSPHPALAHLVHARLALELIRSELSAAADTNV